MDYLIACSDLAGKWLYSSKVLKKKNYILIKNGIDTKTFIFNKAIREEKRKELSLKDNFVIGHIGRFAYAKNHKFLIKIFKEISLKNSNAVLLLIGTGSLVNNIKNQVKELSLEDKVVFLGSRNDIPQLLQAIDLIIFPSFYEGLPLTIVEAQTAGVPCVISDRITNEVVLTDLIQKLSINIDEKVWADRAMKTPIPFRNDKYFQKIVDNGYDIKSICKKLINLYLSI